MSEKPDESGARDAASEAARALAAPDDADLDVLSAVHKGLHAVPSGIPGVVPWQRPPQMGEEGLATRHPR